MDYGIFDHLDRNSLPLNEFYEASLKLIEAYERAGFYAYHVAEHHSTPIGMAPSPSVFLSAIAQRTKTLRFGPMVYALPLHHPLRLIEEICMVDQLSGGRLEIGFGRGSSPTENALYGQDPAKAQAMYTEGRELILQGLTQKTLNFEGNSLQVQRRADGARAAAKAPSADVVRRPLRRSRRARGAAEISTWSASTRPRTRAATTTSTAKFGATCTAPSRTANSA